MPDGSSSAAPVISPGPKLEKKRLTQFLFRGLISRGTQNRDTVVSVHAHLILIARVGGNREDLRPQHRRSRRPTKMTGVISLLIRLAGAVMRRILAAPSAESFV